MAEDNNKPFQTADLGMAAYFCARGQTVLGCVAKEKRSDDFIQMVFVFKDFPERDQLIEQWLTGHDDSVSAKTYYDKVKLCKRLIKVPVE